MPCQLDCFTKIITGMSPYSETGSLKIIKTKQRHIRSPIEIAAIIIPAGNHLNDIQVSIKYRHFLQSINHMIDCLFLERKLFMTCLLYTSTSPRDRQKSRM